DNEIVLSDFSVSRRHAALRHESEGWFVYDLMSTNGVQLNQVPAKKAPGRRADRLKVGIFELEVDGEDEHVKPATGASPPPPAAKTPTPPVSAMPAPPPLPAGGSPISNATIVRPLSDFSLDFGLATKDAEM